MTLKKLIEKLAAKGASVQEIQFVEQTYINKQAKLRSDFVKALLSDKNYQMKPIDEISNESSVVIDFAEQDAGDLEGKD